jgi:hypothetical protein
MIFMMLPLISLGFWRNPTDALVFSDWSMLYPLCLQCPNVLALTHTNANYFYSWLTQPDLRSPMFKCISLIYPVYPVYLQCSNSRKVWLKLSCFQLRFILEAVKVNFGLHTLRPFKIHCILCIVS